MQNKHEPFSLKNVSSNVQIVQPSFAQAYPVYVEHGWSKFFGDSLLNLHASNFYIITHEGLDDKVTNQFCEFAESIGLSFKDESIFKLPQGEANKHICNLPSAYNHLIEKGADRKSVLLALGGGVVGDFCGFTASTLLRGLRFVQIPTTLLAAVDSSVGGKVAVNVDHGKNMVGSFYHPVEVYFNLLTLKTLPQSEWRSGLAEMVKHAFLDPSGQILKQLETSVSSIYHPEDEALQQAVLNSIAFKAWIVSQDEKEQSVRAVLNLGHTTAHAIESATHYRKFSHGEAVSRGIVTALFLSKEILSLPETELERMLALMERLHLPSDCAGLTAETLLNEMRFDKKSEKGSPRFVLLSGIGHYHYGKEITPELFIKAWEIQRQRYGGGA